MSGGSYNYAYSKVEDMAGQLIESSIPLRRVFGKHLQLIAKAMHDIEWVDSCDCSPGDELEAIRKVFGDEAKKIEMKALIEEGNATIKKLQEAMEAKP